MKLEEKILIKLRETREYCYGLTGTFEDKDIRISFFDGYHSILSFYYCSLIYNNSDLYVQNMREVYNRRDILKEDLKKNLQSFRNLVNSKFLIDTWSNFELFITILCSAIFEPSRIDELCRADYSRVRKSISDICLSDLQKEKLQKQLIKRYFAHVNSNPKFNSLLTYIAHNYKIRNLKKDREFLEFYGGLRNCIHSNYIFFGNNKTYIFEDVKFTFEDNKLVNINPLKEDTLFNLSVELDKIVRCIINSITYKGLIYDPSHELLDYY